MFVASASDAGLESARHCCMGHDFSVATGIVGSTLRESETKFYSHIFDLKFFQSFGLINAHVSVILAPMRASGTIY